MDFQARYGLTVAEARQAAKLPAELPDGKVYSAWFAATRTQLVRQPKAELHAELAKLSQAAPLLLADLVVAAPDLFNHAWRYVLAHPLPEAYRELSLREAYPRLVNAAGDRPGLLSELLTGPGAVLANGVPAQAVVCANLGLRPGSVRTWMAIKAALPKCSLPSGRSASAVADAFPTVVAWTRQQPAALACVLALQQHSAMLTPLLQAPLSVGSIPGSAQKLIDDLAHRGATPQETVGLLQAPAIFSLRHGDVPTAQSVIGLLCHLERTSAAFSEDAACVLDYCLAHSPASSLAHLEWADSVKSTLQAALTKEHLEQALATAGTAPPVRRRGCAL